MVQSCSVLSNEQLEMKSPLRLKKLLSDYSLADKGYLTEFEFVTFIKKVYSVSFQEAIKKAKEIMSTCGN